MPEINTNRPSSQPTSTEVTGELLERAGVLEKGDTNKVGWTASDKTFAQSYDEKPDVSGRLQHMIGDSAAAFARKVAADPKGAAADAVKAASFAKDAIQNPTGTALKVVPKLAQDPGFRTSALNGAAKVIGQVSAFAVKRETSAAGAVAGAELSLGLGFVQVAVLQTKVLVAAFAEGDRLNALSKRDAIECTAVALLSLDDGFRAADMARFEKNGKSVVNLDKLQKALENTHEVTANTAAIRNLQRVADEGTHAGLEAVQMGRDVYLRAHPGAAARLQTDVAFNKGFECAVWCAAQPDANARLSALRTSLESRDVRMGGTGEIHG